MHGYQLAKHKRRNHDRTHKGLHMWAPQPVLAGCIVNSKPACVHLMFARRRYSRKRRDARTHARQTEYAGARRERAGMTATSATRHIGQARLSILAMAVLAGFAASEGEDTVYLLGNVPQRIEWLGAYKKQGPSKHAKKGLVDGRHYYAKQGDQSKFLWYNKRGGQWYVGKLRALGHAAGVLHVNDVAPVPEQIRGRWQAWQGPQRGWLDAPELRVLGGREGRAVLDKEAAALAHSPTTVMLAGETPSGLRHEWLGVYERYPGQLVNGRHAYVKKNDGSKMLWFGMATGSWYCGAKASLGQSKGVLMAQDVAVSPDRIQPGAWKVGQGEGKGFIPVDRLRCLHAEELAAALQHMTRSLEASSKTVYMLDSPAAGALGGPAEAAGKAMPWQGAYTAESPEDGRYTYVRKDPSSKGSWVLWYDARKGIWSLGQRRPQAVRTRTLFSVYDGALLPHDIKGTWRHSLRGSWAPSSLRCVVGVEGAALLREQQVATAQALAQSAEAILLVGVTGPAAGHEWMGQYRRRDAALINGRHVLVHEDDEKKVMWYDAKSGSWCVALHEEENIQRMRLFPNRAVLKVADPALTPERIAGVWTMRSGSSWTEMPSLRSIGALEGEGAIEVKALELAITKSDSIVYLTGATPPSFAREWMGPYIRQPSIGSGVRPWYRHERDSRRELRYHARSGEWRVGRQEAATGQHVTAMSVYDGALRPEISTPAWRVSGGTGWQDAPELRCRAGSEGKKAFAADQVADGAAADLQSALTPGWFFSVRAPPVLAALRRALQLGVRPARAYYLLSRARTLGIGESVLEAARQQLAITAAQSDRSAQRPWAAEKEEAARTMGLNITSHTGSQAGSTTVSYSADRVLVGHAGGSNLRNDAAATEQASTPVPARQRKRVPPRRNRNRRRQHIEHARGDRTAE